MITCTPHALKPIILQGGGGVICLRIDAFNKCLRNSCPMTKDYCSRKQSFDSSFQFHGVRMVKSTAALCLVLFMSFLNAIPKCHSLETTKGTVFYISFISLDDGTIDLCACQYTLVLISIICTI